MTAEPISPTRRRGPLIAGAALAAVVLAAAGYFAGHASAGGPGPDAPAVDHGQ
jgi:hypothetical protein